MKKFAKIGCLGVIGLVVVVAILGALLGGGDDSADTSTNTATTEEAATDKKAATDEKAVTEEEAPEEVEVAGVGTTVDVGDAAFTVNEKTTAAEVGPSMLPETASGKYVVINVTYKNNGNEATTIDSSFFKLMLGEKTYEADSMASMSSNQNEDGSMGESMFLQEVNPDSEITGNIVFDVSPDVADSTELQLQVQSGIFGTETAVINLQ